MAVVLTALMLVYPEWYVVDVIGILTAAGAAALFGISLAVLPTILLLVALIAYDYIAVYKTKHMLKLAEGVTDMNLPIIFVLPMKLNYSYIRSKVPIKELKEGERETFIMGLGDAVMPTILAVSANAFVVAPAIGFVNIPGPRDCGGHDDQPCSAHVLRAERQAAGRAAVPVHGRDRRVRHRVPGSRS